VEDEVSPNFKKRKRFSLASRYPQCKSPKRHKYEMSTLWFSSNR